MVKPALNKLIVSLAAAIILVSIASLLFGSIQLSLTDLFTRSEHALNIVWQLRLPRLLLALSVGAMLAYSGCAMQGLFRNSLADPSLIGVSAGASLGASVFIFFSGSLIGSNISILGGTAIGACLGGSLAVIVIYHIARHGAYVSVSTMLLAGMALTALAAGFNQLLQFFSSDQTLRQMSLWHMGSLSGADYLKSIIALLVSSICFVLLYQQRRTLNAFLLGESEARHLGINITRSKNILIFIVAIATGCALALCGSIVFIGLIVPHLCRMLVGPDHRVLLPISTAMGALLLSSADLAARMVLLPSELPVGLLIAFIGAPFFIVLLRKQKAYEF